MKDNEEKMGKSDRKQGHRARQRRNEEQRGKNVLNTSTKFKGIKE